MFTQVQRKRIEEELGRKMIRIKSERFHDDAILFLSERLNQQFESITLQKVELSSLGASYLSKSLTINLQELLLNKNKIGNKGCKFLSRANWPHLHYICLNENKIDVPGVLHLSKANWKFLTYLIIMGNYLSHNSLKMLIKFDCKSLSKLSVTNTFLIQVIRMESTLNHLQIKHLFLADWKNMGLIWANMNEANFEVERAYLKALFKEKFPNGVVSLKSN